MKAQALETPHGEQECSRAEPEQRHSQRAQGGGEADLHAASGKGRPAGLPSLPSEQRQRAFKEAEIGKQPMILMALRPRI
jgi:hypothetical protein